MGEDELSTGTIVKRLSDGSRFLVAQPTANMFCLIGMKDGNRWSEPTDSKDLSSLTNNQSGDFEVVKLGRDR